MSEPSKTIDVADLRKPYNPKTNSFEVNDIKDPFSLFCNWFSEVLKQDTTVEANAMCLATATSLVLDSSVFIIISVPYHLPSSLTLPFLNHSTILHHLSDIIFVQASKHLLLFIFLQLNDFLNHPLLRKSFTIHSSVNQPLTTTFPNHHHSCFCRDGKPSVRVVLLKGYTQQGFTFFTNYNSRKGKELNENPEAYILFYWPAFQRQVRVEGKVEKVGEYVSGAYFARRPRESQVSACASAQSSVVAGKEALETKRLEVEKKFENRPVEKPEDWGGYLLKPRSYEFWQGQTDRFHDRILFRKQEDYKEVDAELTKIGENGWIYERLCP